MYAFQGCTIQGQRTEINRKAVIVGGYIKALETWYIVIPFSTALVKASWSTLSTSKCYTAK